MEERAGVSRNMVGYVEKGMRMPTLEMLLRLSHALELDLSEVIGKAQKRLQ